ncbi:DUF6364 family protein [Pedobacter rhodius]|uniref:DUF6364 family protein n=1 Tax=Pedobacter rhodius TaxID=3004098 RepID=A0ABT4KS09_9SPHI|nr:DUF6364 family protein [Pedobacter sp. SJ11]MCZ4221711.1 DUF6364 family protein [Pedobacter sp. SJ11]
MNTKLTLTIDESVIKQAKAYAEKQGRSLSAVVENYLKAVTKNEENDTELSPIVKSLKGAFKMSVDFDYKEELNKIREEKYQKYLNNDSK